MPEEVEPLIIEGRIRIPYRWPAGRVGGRFFELLRDEGKLYGLACAACSRVVVPPRPRCLGCGAVPEDWVAVGPVGVVESWTLRPGEMDEILALIRLEGADTSLLHKMLGMELENMHRGLEVEAVFAEPGDREGSIRDILGFRIKREDRV